MFAEPHLGITRPHLRDQAKEARTVTAAMPVVNAKARAKITAIFFMTYPSFGR
jgi:hypothetical protein